MKPQPQKLSQYLDLHKGETAWLFGKGPSLDSFDFSVAGDLRVAINDVAAIVPGCRYGFAHDTIEPWRDVYEQVDPGFILFQPWRQALKDAQPACTRHTFDGSPMLSWARERELVAGEGLAFGPGTLSEALQVLWIMGVSAIICVGIDGGAGLSRRAEWRTELRKDHERVYENIRNHFIERAEQLGVAVRFYEPEQGAVTGADVSCIALAKQEAPTHWAPEGAVTGAEAPTHREEYSWA